MSFDQKKNDNMEIDELNIKSHLNTSFDVEGISVSEDLINRTLAAIKKQSQDAGTPVVPETVKQPERKVIPWLRYTRNIAAVAAAGLILVIGFNGLNQMGKKSDETKDGSMSYERTTNEEKADSKVASESTSDAAADSESSIMEYAVNADESAPQLIEESKELKFAADALTENESDNALLAEGAAGIAATSEAPVDSVVEGDSLLIIFREICPILPEAAESIIIESSNGSSVELKDKEEINNFFLQMESYTLSESTSVIDGNDYMITINSAVETFTMAVKDSIVATDYLAGEIRQQRSYNISGYDLLLQDLAGWFK